MRNSRAGTVRDFSVAESYRVKLSLLPGPAAGSGRAELTPGSWDGAGDRAGPGVGSGTACPGALAVGPGM